jgi:hypothetical protein
MHVVDMYFYTKITCHYCFLFKVHNNPHRSENDNTNSVIQNVTQYEEGQYMSPDMGTLEIPTESNELRLHAMSPMTSSATSRENSSFVSKDDTGSHQSKSTVEWHRKKKRRDHYIHQDSSSRCLGKNSLIISVPSENGSNREDCTASSITLHSEEYIQKVVEASNGAQNDHESISEYDERAILHLRRNLKLVVRQKVFCEKKFLTDKSLLMMKYGTEQDLPSNVLGIVLINLNKERMSVLERVVFWRKWGMEVKRTLNDLKSSVSRLIKEVVLKGKNMIWFVKIQ